MLDISGVRIGMGGRGSAWRINIAGRDCALRHYRRGGWVARVNKNRYLWQGVTQTRCIEEFNVLRALDSNGVRVAWPVLAAIERCSWFSYKALLITRWVEHEGTLASCDRPDVWFAAGVQIARMHQSGVYHADLNVHNILFDTQSGITLIDFDKARMPVTEPAVLRANMARLFRSVKKVCPQVLASCWPQLLDGYQSIQK
jgi:3-deoxy-D-manno-octulosonic acid kinase